MCFSATASFVSGGALTVAGLMTVRLAKKSEDLPLAAVPLLFGAQQVIEGILWSHMGEPTVQAAATLGFTLFSHVLWPFYVPLALWLAEQSVARRKTLGYLTSFGALVSAILAFFLLAFGATSRVADHHLVYHLRGLHSIPVLVLYLVSVLVSSLVSSRRFINAFGIALLVTFFVSLAISLPAVFSVWCFFAAALSLFIVAEFS